MCAGILYSTELPFMRWKRSPALAASCILVVRALAVQLGFYYHMQVGRLMKLTKAGGKAAWCAGPHSLVQLGCMKALIAWSHTPQSHSAGLHGGIAWLHTSTACFTR